MTREAKIIKSMKPQFDLKIIITSDETIAIMNMASYEVVYRDKWRPDSPAIEQRFMNAWHTMRVMMETGEIVR